ncbi:alpha/beta hydrolase [Brevundimonas sp. R86498]|uniref:alpha/beta hydrolase n=1 Tax=Brevundimonas sp. R86498 TaxID=3093845 RepID=UPI0037C5D59D
MITSARGPTLTRRLALGLVAAFAPFSQALAQRPALSARQALGPLPQSWRDAEVIDLWSGPVPGEGFEAQPLAADFPPGFFRNVARPTLHVFRPQVSNGAAVLVIPGGAYTFLVRTHEGAETAEALAALGYTVFVLIHRLPGEGWTGRSDVPLQDAQRAVRVIRANAARFEVRPDHVAVLGYSAGGHLAATLATGYGEIVHAPRDAVDALSARPDAAALIYPVITLDPAQTNPQTALSLLGPDPAPEAIVRRSPDHQVSATTPPVFLVHALDDEAVPPENSLLMLAALRRAGVPAEAHLVEEGGHGFGLGPVNAPAGQWLGLMHAWLTRSLAGAAARTAP